MKHYILFIFTLFIFSCKENISLPLESQTPQLVIEGEIHDGIGPYYVKLSMSKAYNTTNDLISINPTYAIISDNTGAIDTLTKLKDGLYQTNKIIGAIGNTYYLNVLYNNTTYTAQSTLNSVPTIDSIYAFTFILKPESKFASIKIKEPALETNFYRYFVKINNKSPERQYVFDDKLINGTTWNFTANQDELKVGDSVEFFLLGIDKANFEYFKVLIQNSTLTSNGNTTAAPINPTSNITNGALGYFSAHSRQSRKLFVK